MPPTDDADGWSAGWRAPRGRDPDIDTFVELAEAAFSELPEGFRALCTDVTLEVADWPDADTLDHFGLDSAYDLLGLFHGVGLAHGAATPWTGAMPNRISLYRRPILAAWHDGVDELPALIRHVLIHEIGHHFGLSDEDMEAIDAAVDGEDGEDRDEAPGRDEAGDPGREDHLSGRLHPLDVFDPEEETGDRDGAGEPHRDR